MSNAGAAAAAASSSPKWWQEWEEMVEEWEGQLGEKKVYVGFCAENELEDPRSGVWTQEYPIFCVYARDLIRPTTTPDTPPPLEQVALFDSNAKYGMACGCFDSRLFLFGGHLKTFVPDDSRAIGGYYSFSDPSRDVYVFDTRQPDRGFQYAGRTYVGKSEANVVKLGQYLYLLSGTGTSLLIHQYICFDRFDPVHFDPDPDRHLQCLDDAYFKHVAELHEKQYLPPPPFANETPGEFSSVVLGPHRIYMSAPGSGTLYFDVQSKAWRRSNMFGPSRSLPFTDCAAVAIYCSADDPDAGDSVLVSFRGGYLFWHSIQRGICIQTIQLSPSVATECYDFAWFTDLGCDGLFCLVASGFDEGPSRYIHVATFRCLVLLQDGCTHLESKGKPVASVKFTILSNHRYDRHQLSSGFSSRKMAITGVIGCFAI